MGIMRFSVAFIGVTAVAGGASADPNPKKLKGEFLCGTYTDGKIVTVLKGGKVNKITDTVACVFHFADPEEPGHSVHLRTLHAGKEIKVVDGTANVEGESSKDFEVYLKPNEAFKPCEDFDIQVGIFDPGGQFEKTIKVQQSCPKPPPLKAELTCQSEYGDGTQVKFPKTKKLGGRLEKPIECMLYSKNAPAGVALNGAVWVKGKPPHKDLMAETPGGGQKMDASLEPDTDFSVCSTKFSIQASLTDADGAERWTGKLDIPAQLCPD
jgi:hypothetical protein